MKAVMKKASGFTIFELLVSISLFAILSITLVSAIPRLKAYREKNNTSEEVVKALYLAKQKARSTGLPTGIEFYVIDRCYKTAAGNINCLPNDIPWKVTSTTGELNNEQQIIFYENGSSTGGEIVVGDGSSRTKITISWLTGQITFTKS
ncbi:hypothetical protein GE543_12425 [Pseudomonas sp. SZ57]|uniref:GspH/FimT family pseudopilin n=2 Tax=Pseudomonas TaxID=286 RepID=UPI001325F2BF|nr:type II secretion system GspH family protein [Pseudomonas syringae]MQQ35115.1 hypothetical protein [Pseudomonas sp. SZ57]